MRAANIHYELADRCVATNYGGIGIVHNLVRELGLAEEIDERLHVLKLHVTAIASYFSTKLRRMRSSTSVERQAR